MGIEVVEGRQFSQDDIGPSAQLVAIINERAAKIFYPGESPIGRRLRPCCGDDFPWLSIVGVAADVKQGGLDAETGTEFYFLNPQVAPTGYMSRTQNWVLRTEVAPESVAGQVQQTVWDIDSKLPIADLQTMDSVLSQSVARPRFMARLLGVFGVLALLLAAIGTYGVMSYTVAERMHEMGIRMALGARGQSVLRLVLGQGLRMAAVGLVLGLAGAFALTRLMSSMLFAVGATDPFTFVAVPGVLMLVAVAACLIPARRATRADPIQVLRQG
jgi:predicted permease